MERLLTIKDVCSLTQATRRTVLKWIERDGLKAYKVAERLWRIRERELQRFLKTHQIEIYNGRNL